MIKLESAKEQFFDFAGKLSTDPSITNSILSDNSRKKSGTVDELTRSNKLLESIKVNSARNSISYENKPTDRFSLTVEAFFNKGLKSDEFNKISNASNSDDVIYSSLYSMKQKMLEKMDFYKTLLEKRYDDYINKIKKITKDKARRLNTVFNKENSTNFRFSDSEEEPMSPKKYITSKTNSPTKKDCDYVKEYTNKIVDKIQYNLDFHDKVCDSIDKNFEILSNFLTRSDMFYDNPLQNFVNDNAETILNSWLFAKIDFEKLNMINLIEDEKIPDNLKNFVYQDSENKFSIITVKKSENYNFSIKLLLDNYCILERLSLLGINHEEYTKIFSSIFQKDIIFQKLINLKLKNTGINDIIYNNFFPNIEKLSIFRTPSKFNFIGLSRNFKYLKELNLKDAKIFNQNVSCLINELSELENLEILDLSFNHISVVELNPINKPFHKLNILSFKQNKLYKFHKLNMKVFPNLKLLDLSSNQFTSERDLISIQSCPNLLLLANKIPYLLTKRSLNISYIEYLINSLLNFEYTIKYLDLSFVFDINHCHKIKDFLFSPSIKYSLKKLNLSYNVLNSKFLMEFFKLNVGFLNLKDLNISNNTIDDSLFEELGDYDTFELEEDEDEDINNHNLSILFENLESIDLSYNNITVASLSNILTIIKNHKLRRLNLTGNPIEMDMSIFIQQDLQNLSSQKQDLIQINSKLKNFLLIILESNRHFEIIFSKKLKHDLRAEYVSTHPVLNKIIFLEG